MYRDVLLQLRNRSRTHHQVIAPALPSAGALREAHRHARGARVTAAARYLLHPLRAIVRNGDLSRGRS